MQKHLLRVLGLSLLAAVGLMAFATAGAQAAEFRILGSAALATGATFGGSQIGTGTLKVPTLNIEIVCQKLSVLEGKILSGPAGTALGKILFEECVVWSIKSGTLELIEKLPCQILDISGGSGKVGHITATANLQVFLHINGKTFILASKDGENRPFAIANYTSGTGCPIPLKQEITGNTVFKLVTGDLTGGGAEAVELEVESNEAIPALFPADVLKYGVNTAFVISKDKLFLTGAHKGCTWGAL